ncbi:MAG: O-antigen ligase family protein, partial [Alicyclobacillaceae bacterium]|nr:O-antigen ligase family protein [Alicyclobacillaceae bacterium]
MFRGRYEVRASVLNGPLLAVFVLVLLSGLAAPYKTVALNGDFTRFEGTLTYLCYFALFFIAANVEYTDRKVNMLLSALAVPAVVNAIVSLMYFYGHDLFQIPWFRAMVVPPGPAGEKAQGYLVTTLANPNYLSGFASVATAVFLARALVNAGRWRHWIRDVVLAVLSFASLLASLSTSGFLALVVTVPVLAIVAVWVRAKRWWIPAIVSIVAFVVVFVGLNHHNPSVWKETFGTLFQEGATAADAALTAGMPKAYAADSPAPNAPDGVYLPPAHTGAGTGRVYIWQRTLEMIAEKPWLGHGLDTFMFYFPQDDPEKNANLSDFNIIVDKPHNFY